MKDLPSVTISWLLNCIAFSDNQGSKFITQFGMLRLDFNTKDNEFLLDDDDPELERRKDILNEMQESSNYNDSNIRKCFKFCVT